MQLRSVIFSQYIDDPDKEGPAMAEAMRELESEMNATFDAYRLEVGGGLVQIAY